MLCELPLHSVCVHSHQPCLSLCDCMACSPPGFSGHGLCQARTPEWVAISSSRVSSWPRDRTCVSCVSFTGRWILYYYATWEAPKGRWHQSNQKLSCVEAGFYSGWRLICFSSLPAPRMKFLMTPSLWSLTSRVYFSSPRRLPGATFRPSLWSALHWRIAFKSTTCLRGGKKNNNTASCLLTFLGFWPLKSWFDNTFKPRVFFSFWFYPAFFFF